MGSTNAKPSTYVEPQWIPDSDSSHCSHCLLKFTLRRRRHHCRSCGEIFCSACWGTKLRLPKHYEYGETLQPVCHTCLSFFQGKLRKLQITRHVAMLRVLKTQKHTPGPPLIPENVRSDDQIFEDMKLGKGLNVSKSYVEIYSAKIAHWRPIGKDTCVVFCRKSSVADEVAHSSRKISGLDTFEVPTPAVSSDRENPGPEPEVDATERSERTLVDIMKEDEDYKNSAWTVSLDAILHCVLDASIDHGVDYITVETALEIFYIQGVSVLGGLGSGSPSALGEVSAEAMHFQPNQSSTIAIYEELKELLQLMQQRVTQREEMEAAGEISSSQITRSASTILASRPSNLSLNSPPTGGSQQFPDRSSQA